MDLNRLSDRLLGNLYTLSSFSKQKQLLNLGKGELCVLIALLKHGSLTPGELMKLTDTSSAHVAKILRNLQSKGEVNKEVNDSDKRSAVINITDSGRKHLYSMYDQVVENTVSLLEKLGEDDSRELLRITDRIMEIEGMNREAAE